MKTTDKFLIGIVIAIVLIVVTAFVVTLTRPEETYLPDDSPENVTHNYLLAIQQKDYERAYGYLSPELLYYPTSVADFESDINSSSWQFRDDQDVSLSVEGVEMKGERATVEVLETRFYGADLLDSGQYVSTFEMDLILLEGQWKITAGDAYFLWCWENTTRYGCN